MLSPRLLPPPILVALGTLTGANAVLASPAAVAAQNRPAVPTQGFLVENEAHGLCLDAQSRHDGRNDDPVQLWKCQANPFTLGNQLWNIVPKDHGDEIVNGAHNLCLQAQRQHDGSNGDKVRLWRCLGTRNQVWNWVLQQ
jgi:Ricin-type beta-trefoil lectin domain